MFDIWRYRSRLCCVMFFYFAVISVIPVVPVAAEERGQLVDVLVATIDGEPLLLSEASMLLAQQGLAPEVGSEARLSQVKAHLRDVVLARLLEKEAERFEITVNESMVERYIEEVARQGGLTVEALKSDITARGLKFEDYQKQVKRELLRISLLNKTVREKISIVEEDIDTYFRRHPELRPDDGAVFVRQILLPKSEDNLRRIMSMRKRLLKGEAWQVVADRGYHELGYVVVEDLRQDLAGNLKKLKADEVSEVIDDESSYMLLIRSRSVKDGGLSEELRNRIRSELYEDKYQRELARYLGEELPRRYEVDLAIDGQAGVGAPLL